MCKAMGLGIVCYRIRFRLARSTPRNGYWQCIILPNPSQGQSAAGVCLHRKFHRCKKLRDDIQWRHNNTMCW